MDEQKQLDDCLNLWRVTDFVRSWEKAGFVCHFITRNKAARDRLPPNLSPFWDDHPEQDLLCTSALSKASKPTAIQSLLST